MAAVSSSSEAAPPQLSSRTYSPKDNIRREQQRLGSNNPDGGDDVDDVNYDPTSQPPAQSAQSFTPRSLLVGLAIGTLITFSNTYFGLQTGWISSMAMPSSLIGFAIFKSVSRHLSFPFSPVENVLIQTVAGAVGTMPLGCGFVGVIPALEFLLREKDGEEKELARASGGGGGMEDGDSGPLRLGLWKLVIWSLGVCMFGVVFAVPLRKEVIIREKLKFPSGTATALMIRVLHGGSGDDEKKADEDVGVGVDSRSRETERLLAPETTVDSSRPIPGAGSGKRDKRKDWKARIRLLVMAFAVSAFFVRTQSLLSSLRSIESFQGVKLTFRTRLCPRISFLNSGIFLSSAFR